MRHLTAFILPTIITCVVFGHRAAARDATDNEAITVKEALTRFFASLYIGDSKTAANYVLPAKERFAIEPRSILRDRLRITVEFTCAAQRLRAAWYEKFSAAPPLKSQLCELPYLTAIEFNEIALAIEESRVECDHDTATLCLPEKLIARMAASQFPFKQGLMKLVRSDGWKLVVDTSDANLANGGTDVKVRMAQSTFDVIVFETKRLDDIELAVRSGKLKTESEARAALEGRQ